MLDFFINNPPPTIPANSTYTTIIACPLVSIKNPVTLDTTGNTIPIVVITIPIEKINAFMIIDLLVINDVKMGCVHVVF